MTASFRATQAIWPTLLRLPGAVDQCDSCLHLRALLTEIRGRDMYSVISLMLKSEIGPVL